MKKILFIFCMLVLLNTGCKKDDKANTYTIKGKFVISCTDNTPVKGVYVFVYNSMPGSSLIKNCNQTEKGAVTDENGEFLIIYNDRDVCGNTSNNGDVYVGYSDDPRTANVSLMSGLPPYAQWSNNKKKEFQVELHKERMIYENFKIKTINSYTDKDTLYLDTTNHGTAVVFWKKIPGPFQNNDLIYSKKVEGVNEYVEGYQKHISPYYKVIYLKRENTDPIKFIYEPEVIRAADPIYKNCDTHTDLIFELP